MNNKNLYIDINVLQTVPSSNINRDDTGTPKTAMYGGVVRSRVSSQSWKRAIREAFKSNDEEWLDSYRTLKVPNLLFENIKTNSQNLSDDDIWEKVDDIFKAAKIKLDKDKQTKALLLVSQAEINKLTEYALSDDEMDAKNIKKILKENDSLDLALFGRMVADNPELNVEATSQVAHAISTHEIVPEFDFYTALDDEQTADNAGSAMLGTIEYNSSTLYRYANINFNELKENIGADLAVKGIREFIKDFILTMPTGKQNTFANKTLPQYIMVTIRDDTPVNLVSAFETPVKARDGYVVESIKKLEQEFVESLKFVDTPIDTIVLTSKESNIDKKADNLSNFLNVITSSIEKVNNENDNN